MTCIDNREFLSADLKMRDKERNSFNSQLALPSQMWWIRLSIMIYSLWLNNMSDDDDRYLIIIFN